MTAVELLQQGYSLWKVGGKLVDTFSALTYKIDGGHGRHGLFTP